MPFTERTLEFLFENRVRDSKSWFEENRAEYENVVLQPLRELVTELTPQMLALDSQLICEPKVGRSISRIYRDTRFSKDKSTFRDVMWCTFKRRSQLYWGPPGFFFELSPRGLRWGCGYYQCSPDTMAAARELMLAGDRSFQKARRALEKLPQYQMEDARYRRSRYPGQPEALRRWLDLKNLCALAGSTDMDLLYSPSLSQWLGEELAGLKPFYDFCLRAESRREHPGNAD